LAREEAFGPHISMNNPIAIRILAALFAAIWIAGGIGAALVSITGGRWQYILISPFAIGYGLIWVLVMLLGRQLKPGETLPALKALLSGNLQPIVKGAISPRPRRLKRK